MPELPRILRVRFRAFLKEFGGTAHPSEELSVLTLAGEEGIRIDRSVTRTRCEPSVSIFSTGVLEAAIRGTSRRGFTIRHRRRHGW